MTSGIKRALIVAGVLAVLYGAAQTAVLMKASTGNDKMREIAAAIQEGASAYLKRQYLTIGIVGNLALLGYYKYANFLADNINGLTGWGMDWPKVVLPLATGGSPHHMLALDYALRPVLQSLGAKSILPGIYATDAQVTLTPEGSYHVQADIAARLDDAVNVLVTETLRPSPAQATRFAPVHFSQVRCSV